MTKKKSLTVNLLHIVHLFYIIQQVLRLPSAAKIRLIDGNSFSMIEESSFVKSNSVTNISALIMSLFLFTFSLISCKIPPTSTSEK